MNVLTTIYFISALLNSWSLLTPTPHHSLRTAPTFDFPLYLLFFWVISIIMYMAYPALNRLKFSILQILITSHAPINLDFIISNNYFVFKKLQFTTTSCSFSHFQSFHLSSSFFKSYNLASLNLPPNFFPSIFPQTSSHLLSYFLSPCIKNQVISHLNYYWSIMLKNLMFFFCFSPRMQYTHPGSNCYGPNAYVPLPSKKFICWNPSIQCVLGDGAFMR